MVKTNASNIPIPGGKNYSVQNVSLPLFLIKKAESLENPSDYLVFPLININDSYGQKIYRSLKYYNIFNRKQRFPGDSCQHDTTQSLNIIDAWHLRS